MAHLPPKVVSLLVALLPTNNISGSRLSPVHDERRRRNDKGERGVLDSKPEGWPLDEGRRDEKENLFEQQEEPKVPKKVKQVSGQTRKRKRMIKLNRKRKTKRVTDRQTDRRFLFKWLRLLLKVDSFSKCRVVSYDKNIVSVPGPVPGAGNMDGYKFILFTWIVFDFLLLIDGQSGSPEASGQNVEDSAVEGPSLSRKRTQTRIIQRLMGRRQSRGPILGKKEICYEMVGCFELPRKPSLKKPPQSPDIVDTKFWLYTRSSTDKLELKYDELLLLRKDAQLLQYGDGLESIKNSAFDPKKNLKVLIHGFKGSGKDKGALSGVKEFLKLEDVNVLVVDWEKGAADSYATAVANTQLIGRQTAVMLIDMISLGADPKKIHVIGFSLGAHIAGCAGEMLKLRGHKLGRITGLDPASPLFKHHVFREPATKLDADKADFVDVIHTDGSRVFTDGFGILRPIGHVDFFPNGGREQRGCSDGRGSVVVSHFEGTKNSSVVCSHVRAWQLFLESVINLQNPNGCQFIAYPCQGGGDKFAQGKCFVEPKERCLPGDPECNIMGMGAYPNGARGALYLATRDSEPYCGEQMQLKVEISPQTEKTRGYLHLRLKHGDHFTNFKLSDELSDSIQGGTQVNSIGVAETDTISGPKTPIVDALLSFQSLEFQTSAHNSESPGKIVSFDNVHLMDSSGNRWHYCGKQTPMQSINGTTFSALHVQLQLNPC